MLGLSIHNLYNRPKLNPLKAGQEAVAGESSHLPLQRE